MSEGGPQAAGNTVDAVARAALESVRYDWGDAYDIGYDDEHGWHAKRRDGRGDILTAPNPDGLYEVIAADYRDRPVGRDYSAPLDD
jgi:hypothetical protein